jgi:glycosyltransferase involved in cell wall biosynthesis
MNLLHVIPRFIGGGPERHLLALAAAWQKTDVGIRQKVLVLDPPVSAALLVKARRLGIEIQINPELSVIRDAVQAADVVDISFWNHPRLYDLLRHELPPSRWVIRSAVAGTTLPQVLTPAVGRLPDRLVLSTSASLATAAVREARLRGCPVESIPALADMSRLEGFRPRPHEGIRVGYLGQVEPTKMHPRFADLCLAVADGNVCFEVFGSGSWRGALEQRFDAAGASDRVRFHGPIEDIRRAFEEMDIFGYPLAPDTYATSEKTIQEAMWAGIPPVVFAGNGSTALVDHEQTGLVCQSEADYPAAIRRLADDDALRRRLGQAARDHARAHFDPDRNAARFGSIFRSVSEAPRRSPLPFPGRDTSGAWRFFESLGPQGHVFGVSFAGDQASNAGELAAADASIGKSSAVLATGEGGIVHYRNAYPEDPHLRLWCGLTSLHAGNNASAERDFRSAIEFGLPAARVLNHLACCCDVA